MTSGTIQTSRLGMKDLVLLTILAGIFFTFMLGNRPLSPPDEGRYVEISREIVATGDYLTPRLNYVKYFEKPPLFYWVEALFIKLFGLHEFILRLWPALLALLGCVAVAVAGSRIFGRMAGLLSAAILATSTLYYAMSRIILLDLQLSIFLTTGLLFFLIGVHETPSLKRRLYLWGFYACSALAVMSKGLIGILIPGMVIGAWILLLGEWRLLKTLYLPSGITLFLLIAAPWHIMVGIANPEFLNFYFIHEHFLRYVSNVHGRYQPIWYFIPVLLLGLFPWSAFLVQAIKHNLPSSWQERHEHRDSLFLILWAVLVALFFSFSNSKLIPYILPAFPPLAMLIGRYLAASWGSRDFPGVRTGYLIVMIVVLLPVAAVFILPLYWSLPEKIQSLGHILGAWQIVIPLTLVTGAMIAWGLAQYRGFRHAFIALTVTSALFLVEVNAAAPLVDTKSIRTLASKLKPLIKPGDEVAAFRTYYQDLPVYLEQRVTLVDCKNELWFGAITENAKHIAMFDQVELFWNRWKGPSTIYMITNHATYKALKTNPRIKLFSLAQDRRNIIVSNKAPAHRHFNSPGQRPVLSEASGAFTPR